MSILKCIQCWKRSETHKR